MSDGEFTALEVDAEEYDLDDVLPAEGADSVPRGTSLLVSGPAMIGKRELALELVAVGERHGEHAVVVTANQSARRIAAAYRELRGDPERLYLIDCSGTGSRGGVDAARRTYRPSGPGDLTGVGIGMVKATREMGPDAEAGVRVALLSVSTMLQYTSVKRTFNFLHVMTNRFAAAGYLGVATFDPTLHDDSTVNTVTSLFDGVVDLREDDDGNREWRVRGLSGVPRKWQSF